MGLVLIKHNLSAHFCGDLGNHVCHMGALRHAAVERNCSRYDLEIRFQKVRRHVHVKVFPITKLFRLHDC